MLKEMFSYKGKMTKIIPDTQIKSYQKVYDYLYKKVKNKQLPASEDYLNGNELAINIFKKKYYVTNLEGKLLENRPEDVFIRISAFIASVENNEEKRKEWAEKFYTNLYDGYFLPGGRVLAGAGDIYRLKTLANCFVTQIEEDNIESIYHSAYECARTYSYGGGIGVDMTPLRPKDAVVHNAADRSTGAVSFMDIYSLTTGIIGQSGRRGALMITIDVKHPDAFDFIKVKKMPNWTTKQVVEQLKWSNKFNNDQLKEVEKQVMENTQVRFANTSLKVSDEFMQAVEEQTKFGPNKILVYKKFNKKKVMSAIQSKENHYSYGIPSKDIEEYEFVQKYNSITELNNFLHEKYNVLFSEKDFTNISKRDIYGDIVVEVKDEKYDLAIKKSGDFLQYFASNPSGEIKKLIKARDVWDPFIEGNYKTAEPGIMFWTKMAKYSPSNYVGRPISSTNPCAEVPLEKGGACNLASINLARIVKNGYTPYAEIDFKKLKEITETVIRFLDNVVTWNEELNALEVQRDTAKKTRRLGLGIMGIADLLNQLGKSYDSGEGIQIMEKIMEEIANAAYQASANLAEEKSPSEIFDFEKYSANPFFKEALSEETIIKVKEKGLRNIAILSIAPTGTISNIVKSFEFEGKNYIGVSGGVEPLFALFYNRRSESFGNKMFKVFHAPVQAYIDMYKLNDKVDKIKSIDDLEGILPPYFFRTAHTIVPERRIQIQGICQKYIDHSISSTVNLKEDIEPEVISDIYLKAWKEGLKGITVYRDGSRYPILSVKGKENEFQANKDKQFKLIDDEGKENILYGSDVISLPDGRLTTVYHYLNLHKKKDENKKVEENFVINVN